jgi:hypothetical protein
MLPSRMRAPEPRAISCAACGITVAGRRCAACGRGSYLPSHCPHCGSVLRARRGCSACGAPGA